MMARLIAEIGPACYIPEATVWHRVPPDRCSPDWALEREGQMATTYGLDARERGDATIFLLNNRMKLLALRILCGVGRPWLSTEARIKLQYRIMAHKGFLNGIRHVQ